MPRLHKNSGSILERFHGHAPAVHEGPDGGRVCDPSVLAGQSAAAAEMLLAAPGRGGAREPTTATCGRTYTSRPFPAYDWRNTPKYRLFFF